MICNCLNDCPLYSVFKLGIGTIKWMRMRNTVIVCIKTIHFIVSLPICETLECRLMVFDGHKTDGTEAVRYQFKWQPNVGQ